MVMWPVGDLLFEKCAGHQCIKSSHNPRRQRMRASIASVSVSVKSAGWGCQAVFDVRERGRVHRQYSQVFN